MTKQPDKNHSADVPAPSGHDHVLGKIQPGEFDTELQPAPRKAPKGQTPAPSGAGATGSAQPPGAQQGAVKGLAGLKKKSGGSGKSSPVAHDAGKPAGPTTPAPYAGGEDRLVLPAGGLITMRKSGGLRFSSQQVTVYIDGRVELERDTALSKATPLHTGKLSDSEVAGQYRALSAANFEELPPVSGHQNPDAYAYEIVAHLAGTNYSVEAFDGSIPAPLSPVIQLLTGYLSRSTLPGK